MINVIDMFNKKLDLLNKITILSIRNHEITISKTKYFSHYFNYFK